jgi:lipopolysaccharide export LptBFGC system permease protein LptF
MKLSKLFFIILPVVLIGITFLIIKFIPFNQVNPISNQNDFYSKLNNALQTSQISPLSLTVRDYQNEVEFYTQDDQNNQIKIILSNQKDPYWQIASLQDFLKTAKISNKQIKLVDLSIDHPYATFKNN